MYPRHFVMTERLQTSYFHSGAGRPKRLLLLHGNLSSAAFFLPLFAELARSFEVAAPDLRCFGDTEDLPVDATRGYRDWSDDVYAFARALGWDRFLLVGWSMGGNVAMQFTIDHSEMVEKLILIAPGSPYGFGGSRDEQGTLRQPEGLGCGGGCVPPILLNSIGNPNRAFLRDVLRNLYFNPPFRIGWEWENLFIREIGKIKRGEDRWPGNYHASLRWPFFSAGDKGVLNAMSPPYADLSAFLDLEDKPSVLWIRGEDDQIVSDCSMLEFGALGKMGMIPGWPGNQAFPPQPMIAQTRRFFRRYRDAGGDVIETVIPGGHMCALEHPAQFLSALRAFA